MKKFLLPAILLSANALAIQPENQLTLYFIPSPSGMDWSTPANLAWSALKNRLSFKSHFMGHVLVELQCGQKHELTGMVGRNFDYLNQLLVKGRGLGILFHSFDGSLEEKGDVQNQIAYLSQDGERLNFVKFKLNESQCSRSLAYLTEYREKNVGRYYGLANRPLYGEGAGCSAFGASFAQVAGVLSTEIKAAWSQSVNIPVAFAGPPLKDESVNLFRLMLNADSWARPGEPHQKLFFWSPDKMYGWVKEKIARAHEEKQFTVEGLGKSQGIVFDSSSAPAPAGPIWQQHLDPSLKRNP